MEALSAYLIEMLNFAFNNINNINIFKNDPSLVLLKIEITLITNKKKITVSVTTLLFEKCDSCYSDSFSLSRDGLPRKERDKT